MTEAGLLKLACSRQSSESSQEDSWALRKSIFALLFIMVVDWFCNPGVVVRFHQGAPILCGLLEEYVWPSKPKDAGSMPVARSKFCKCQQENVTLSRLLRRVEIVEGDGFNSRGIGRSLQIGC